MRLAPSYTTPRVWIRLISFWSHPKQCVHFFVRLMNKEWLWYSCHLCCHCWWWSIVRRFHIQTAEPICSARRFRREWWRLQSRQRVPGSAKTLLTPSSVSVQWNTAHERTKCRYLQKAQQCISAMLDVLAPENSQDLWTELCDRHAVCSESRVVVEGRRRSFLMHLLKATWTRNIGAPDGKCSLWWQTSYPLRRWGSLFQPLLAIATTLPDATGWYMEELLLFQTRRKGEWELNL